MDSPTRHTVFHNVSMATASPSKARSLCRKARCKPPCIPLSSGRQSSLRPRTRISGCSLGCSSASRVIRPSRTSEVHRFASHTRVMLASCHLTFSATTGSRRSMASALLRRSVLSAVILDPLFFGSIGVSVSSCCALRRDASPALKDLQHGDYVLGGEPFGHGDPVHLLHQRGRRYRHVQAPGQVKREGKVFLAEPYGETRIEVSLERFGETLDEVMRAAAATAEDAEQHISLNTGFQPHREGLRGD